MREGVPDEVYWVCDYCGKDHDKKEDADNCCNEQAICQIYLKCDDGFEATIRIDSAIRGEIYSLNRHHGLSKSCHYYFRGDIKLGHEVNRLINELIHAPIQKLCDEVYKLGRKIKYLKGLHELDRVVKELND